MPKSMAPGIDWQLRMLSVLRIVIVLLYLQHGLNKIFGFPPSANPRLYVLLTLVPGLARLLETIGGVLLTVGLFTRTTAVILSDEMAFAYFMAHAPRSFIPYVNGGEAAVFLLLRVPVFRLRRRRSLVARLVAEASEPPRNSPSSRRKPEPPRLLPSPPTSPKGSYCVLRTKRIHFCARVCAAAPAVE